MSNLDDAVPIVGAWHHDLVTGAAAIGSLLGMSPARAAREARDGRIPVWKAGPRLWQTTRTALERHIHEREDAALARCGIEPPEGC